MKHFNVKLSEDEYTKAKNIGLWELEQKARPIIVELITSMEQEKYGRKPPRS